MTEHFTIEPKGPFLLETSRAFLAGFTPSSGSANVATSKLRLVFRLDKTFAPAGAALEQRDGVIHGEVFGTPDAVAVKKQVARILSLEHDATAFAQLAARNPVIGKLLEQFPGFRPVCFASPYEAGLWGLIVQRINMKQAAAIKTRIAHELGDTVIVDGVPMSAVPSPAALVTLEKIRGLPRDKVIYLREFAEAALQWKLDPDRLRAMPMNEALEELEHMSGVGSWTSRHIYLRGTGIADEIAAGEPRVLRGVALAYGLKKTPSEREMIALAEGWRPYRMWVCVLVALGLARAGLWNAGGQERRGISSPR